MGTAYTPGLTVSPGVLVRKERRLPLAGEILVSVGDKVEARTPVARALLPGSLATVRAADELGVEPSELPEVLKVAEGDEVREGDLLAEMRGLFGLFTSRVGSPVAGTVEFASAATGHIGIRARPEPVEVTAFVRGRVEEVRPPDAVVVSTRAVLVQGVFGVGGETAGEVACAAASHDAPLVGVSLPADLTGRIVVAGAWAERNAWRLLAERGAAGLVVGSLTDSELRDYLGFDLGLAITGHEDVPFPVLVTEGFGRVPMAEGTFRLLKSLGGREASMSGRTQIRAGAVRPELVSPLGGRASTGTDGIDSMGEGTDGKGEAPSPSCPSLSADVAVTGELQEGSRVRLIRHPHFGLVGRVAELPEGTREIATGARVRVAVVELEGGEGGRERLTVPRSNLELFAG
jgi:hypothetical protein